MRLPISLLLLFAGPIAAQTTPYTVAAQPWPEMLGNHRARVHVEKPAAAVQAHLEWRRHDEQPERKAVLVFDAAGKAVLNARALTVTAEAGDVAFEARTPGDYFIYYFPLAKPAAADHKGQYLAPAPTAWRAPDGPLPQARVLEFQARTAFDSFYPMEVAATPAEVRQLEARHPQPLLVFPEDRDHAIRMRDTLPLRWIEAGPSGRFAGSALRGEFYVFQLGLYRRPGATPAALPVDVRFADSEGPSGARIPASEFTCINLGGVDSRGQAFHRPFTAAAGHVGALWCAVQVPIGAAPGRYSGTLQLLPKNSAPVPVQLDLDVQSDFIRAGGVDQPARLARIQWLNSKIGLTDTLTAPYTPLRVDGRTVHCLGRTVRFAGSGLPESVQAGGQELLAKPVELRVYEKGSPVEWKSRSRVEEATPAHATFVSQSESANYRLAVRTTMEFDGGIGFDVTLRGLADTDVSGVALEIPYRRAAAPYIAGMGLDGGRRPAAWQWKWTDQPARWAEQGSNLEYFVWLGNVHGGLFCRLKSPLDGWRNAGKGEVRIAEQGDEVLFQALSGALAIRRGQELKFSFRLLPTPVKPLPASDWTLHYAHAYKPLDEVQAAGATVLNIHHDTLPNLYINYPFLNLDLLTPYVADAHARGLKVKLYYTIREITTHLPELWALRALDDEIYRTAGTQAHGAAGLDYWLQEHLQGPYVPAWITRTPVGDIDAALRVNQNSRLENFYLEGLAWLVRNVPVDGIYLDEIGYGRNTMQRVRRVLDQRPGTMIDLHGNRTWWSCNSPIGYYMEHLPYVDRLWFGEEFNPDSPPDFWLIEMSGLPFGLRSDMLEKPNPWRGILFGMTARAFWSASPPTAPLWKFLDGFSLGDAEMIGWWEDRPAASTQRADVPATVYRKPGASLVAIASWAKEPAQVKLQIDWKALGLDASRARLTAPDIPGFQPRRSFAPGEAIPVEPGKGWLIQIDNGQ